MRAKKLIALALLATIGTTVQAQIVSSRSDRRIITYEPAPVKEKKPTLIDFYAKAGISLDICDEGSVGFEGGLGIKAPIGKKGAYWGVEIGALSLEYYCWDHHGTNSDIAVCGSPYLGWDFPISEQVSIAPFVGPSVGYGFDSSSFLYGPKGGVNVWITKRWGMGISYQLYLGEMYDHPANKIGFNLNYIF